MPRPIKRLHADAQVVRELQCRARAATSTLREQERASIILLRMKGVSVDAARKAEGPAIPAKIKRARAALDKVRAA